MATMLFNHPLKKCSRGYKYFKSQKKINHLMYMAGIKAFAKMKRNRKI